MDSLDALFCHIDDFCQQFEPQWPQLLFSDGTQQRRQRGLSLSEIMTILVSFHRQPYRHFKAYYCQSDATHRQVTGPQVGYRRNRD